MKNTFARARGLQMLKDIKDPEGEKKKQEKKKKKANWRRKDEDEDSYDEIEHGSE